MSRKNQATDPHAHSTDPPRTSPRRDAATGDGDDTTRHRAVAGCRVRSHRRDDVSTENQPPIRRSDGQVYGG
jgi:hypothetical protein